jgi:PAS domain-containing protein
MNHFMKLPLRIVLPYALFGSLWIYFSDKALTFFVITQENIRLWSTCKGLFYVAITSILLYWLIWAYVRKVHKYQKALEHENNVSKLAQASLQESEELFHKMFSKHSAFMYLLDPVTLSIFDANEAAVEFYGYTLNEFKKMKISNLNTLTVADIRKIVDHAVKEDKNYFIFSIDLPMARYRWWKSA